MRALEKIDRSGHRYTILLCRDGRGYYQPRAENFSVAEADYPWYSFSEQRGMPKVLRRLQPDLVHFCHFNVPFFWAKRKNPFVVTIHDLIKDEFKGCDVYVGDLENEGVGLASYHDLDDTIPAELKTEVDELQEAIVSGEITDTGCISYPEHCPGGLYE